MAKPLHRFFRLGWPLPVQLVAAVGVSVCCGLGLLALDEQLDDPGLRVSASLWHFDTSVERGDGAFFAASGLPPWVGLAAFIDSAAGHGAGVAERLDAMADAFASQGPTAICPVGLMACMAAPVVRLGDPDRARRLYELIVPFSGQGAYFACFAGPIDYHLGLLARALGDEHDARQRFADAAAFCDRLGAPRWRARCHASLEAAPEASVQI